MDESFVINDLNIVTLDQNTPQNVKDLFPEQSFEKETKFVAIQNILDEKWKLVDIDTHKEIQIDSKITGFYKNGDKTILTLEDLGDSEMLSGTQRLVKHNFPEEGNESLAIYGVDHGNQIDLIERVSSVNISL